MTKAEIRYIGIATTHSRSYGIGISTFDLLNLIKLDVSRTSKI